MKYVEEKSLMAVVGRGRGEWDTKAAIQYGGGVFTCDSAPPQLTPLEINIVTFYLPRLRPPLHT